MNQDISEIISIYCEITGGNIMKSNIINIGSLNTGVQPHIPQNQTCNKTLKMMAVCVTWQVIIMYTIFIGFYNI